MNVLGKPAILAEQVIVGILTQEMGLPQDNVWVRDQNKQIPPDTQLYITVGMVDSKVLSVVDTVISTDSPDGMKEIQQVQTVDQIQIDIFSSTTEAIFRRWEILAALSSIYSVQQQEASYFKIYKIPRNFVNTSETEGGSRLNKFSMVISASVWYYKEKVLSTPNGDYYNDFDTRVDDEVSIGTDEGIIEFNISEH